MPFGGVETITFVKDLKKNLTQLEKQLLTEQDEDIITEINNKISTITNILNKL